MAQLDTVTRDKINALVKSWPGGYRVETADGCLHAMSETKDIALGEIELLALMPPAVVADYVKMLMNKYDPVPFP